MSEDWPDPDDLEEEHSHPMGWFQIALYITLISAFAVSIWVLVNGQL